MKAKKLIFMICSIAVLAIVTTISVFAAFTYEIDYDANINIINTDESSTFTQVSKSENLTFTHDENEKIFDYSIKNNSKKILSYDFSLTTVTTKDSLTNAIMVYLNDSFSGTLSNLCAQETSLTKEPIIIPPNNSKNIKLKYVLHSAIEKTFYEEDELQFSTTLNCTVSTLDYKKYTTASNYEELLQASLESSSASRKYIILLNNILLEKDLHINNPVTIDLNGYTISNNNIIVKSELLLRSEKSASITSNVILNDSKSFLWNYSNLISLSPTVTMYDETKAIDYALKKKDDIKYNVSYKVFDNNDMYSDLLINSDGLPYQNNTITSDALNYKIVSLTFKDGRTKSVQVFGNGLLDKIALELDYLNYYSKQEINGISTYPNEVTSDLYLPTKLKQYECSISWLSSNNDIINSNGKTSNAGTGTALLKAIISLDGNSYELVYDISVLKQNNQMKLEYLISKIGTILFRNTYDEDNLNNFGYKQLPSTSTYVDMLSVSDLGIEAIDYKLDSKFSFLYLDKSTPFLALTDVTFQRAAQLTILVDFIDGTSANDGNNKHQEGNISIQIDLSDNKDLINILFDYSKNSIQTVDVLEEILSSRETSLENEKACFVLKREYMGFLYTYEVVEGYEDIYSIIDVIEYRGTLYNVSEKNGERFVIINGIKYIISEGTITIPHTYLITDDTVTVDEIEYSALDLVIIDGMYYQVVEGNIVYNMQEYPIADNKVTIDGLEYFVQKGFLIDGSYYLITSDSITVNNSYPLAQACNINLTKLLSHTMDVQIKVNLYIASDNAFVDSTVDRNAQTNNYKNPLIRLPGAIHINNEGFASEEIFYSVKYQVLQQTDRINKEEISQLTIEDIKGLKDYILLYDLNNAQDIKIVQDSKTTILNKTDFLVLEEVIAWAVGNTKTSLETVVDTEYNFILSDGTNKVTDMEEFAIINTLRADYPHLVNFYNQFLYGGTSDRKNTLNEYQISDIVSVAGAPAYNQIIAWATAQTSNQKLSQYLNTVENYDFGMTYNYLTENGEFDFTEYLLNDGNTTFSFMEEMAILRYVWSMDNELFYDNWLSTVDYKDNDINEYVSNQDKDLSYFIFGDFILDVYNAIKDWAQDFPPGGSGGSYNQKVYDSGHIELGQFMSDRFGSFAQNIKELCGFSDDDWKVKSDWLKYGNTIIFIKYYYAYPSVTIEERNILIKFGQNLNLFDKTTVNGEQVYYFSNEYIVANQTSQRYNNDENYYTYLPTNQCWESLESTVVACTTDISSDRIVSSNYQLLLTWAKSLSHSKIQLLDGSYGEYDYFVSDAKNTISVEEYMFIKSYLDANYITKQLQYGSSYYVDVFNMVLNLEYAAQDYDGHKSDLIQTLGTNTELLEFLIYNSTQNKMFSAEFGGIVYTFDGINTIGKAEYEQIYSLSQSFTNDNQKKNYEEMLQSLLNSNVYLDKSFDDSVGSNFINAIKNQYSSLSYMTITNPISNIISDFMYFGQLSRVVLKSITNESLFTTTDYANKTLDVITGYSQDLLHLDMNNSNLSDISTLERTIDVQYLDVSNNSQIDNIDVLLKLNDGKLAYLDISGTSVDLTYKISYIERLYSTFKGLSYNSNGIDYHISSPDYRFSYASELIYYKKDINLLSATYYSFMLSELTSTKGTRIQVPQYLNVENQRVDLVWKILSGNARMILSGNNIFIDTIDCSDGEVINISCKLQVNGGVYTRYFLIKINK